MDSEDNFLKRWSRRKHETARSEATTPEKPVAPAEPPTAGAAALPPEAAGAQPELPSLDSLKGLASEYKEFLDPAVDPRLRNAALKSLFHDPHFNVMDGLDVYIDDYSKPDPIPESMMKTLVHAKRLLFPEETEEAQASAPTEAQEPRAPDAAAQAVASAPEQPRTPVHGAEDEVPAARGGGESH